MAFTDRLHNRGSISTGYDIDNSLKLESDNSERVNKAAATISGAGNRRTFTISFWTKRTEINGVKQYLFEAGNSDADNDRFTLRFGTGDTLDIQTSATYLVTNRKFRDTSAWYHIVLKVDTTDGTAADRMKLYVNGVEETSFATDNRANINQNFDFAVNNTEDHIIGNSMIEGSAYYNGYITEWIQLDGTAAAPTSFGEFDDSGIWKPKDPSELSFGTNGFWLDFEDSSNLGNDASGGTDFTLTNVAAADQATDTPTNNFATFNPLHYTTKYTISAGATRQNSSVNGWGTSVGSIGVTSGKWYFEIKTPDNNGYTTFGAIDADSILSQYLNGNAHAGDAPYGISYYGGNGGIIVNGSYISGTSFSSYNTQIMGCALDLDNNKIYFSKSGTYGNSGNPVTGANGISLPSGGSGTWFFSTSTYVQPLDTNHGGYTSLTISSAESDANGYGTFEYAPPSGYYALCTKNLAEFG